MANSEFPISPMAESKPELTISAAAVNNEPVELDGTPTSPERMKEHAQGAKQERLSADEQERRAKLNSERKKDEGVVVDLPQTPSAEEFGRSEDASATISNNSSKTKTS